MESWLQMPLCSGVEGVELTLDWLERYRILPKVEQDG